MYLCKCIEFHGDVLSTNNHIGRVKKNRNCGVKKLFQKRVVLVRCLSLS